MAKAKLRLAAGVAGIVFGLIGMAVFATALSLLLAKATGLVWATLIVSVGFMTTAFLLVWVLLLPRKSIADERRQLTKAAAASAAELPVEAAKNMIEKRPIAAVLICASLGLAVANNPRSLPKTLERVLLTIF